MFRPNRIGTPIIHGQEATINTAAWTPNAQAYNAATWNGNVINAAAVLDFARTALVWANGASGVVAAGGNRIALYQQFTITAPLAGDTVGLELNASITMTLPASALIRPVIVRLTAAGVATLGAVTSYDIPTQLEQGQAGPIAVTTLSQRNAHYKQIVITRNTDKDILAGTYAHGFEITDQSLAGYTATYLNMVASIRQLNDQQAVGYRDTLR